MPRINQGMEFSLRKYEKLTQIFENKKNIISFYSIIAINIIIILNILKLITETKEITIRNHIKFFLVS